jgi:DNA-binding GntR family transcriptional regulator
MEIMPRALRTTRVSDAYMRIKEEIRSNRMPPGFQMPEPELALRFGMSRTPMREAVIRLEAEGLVEVIPRRGVRVLPMQIEDIAEIYEILTALEPEAAAGLASRGLTKAEIAPLDDATTRMEAALKHNDLEAWAEADDYFHKQLLETHGNRRLLEHVSLLFDQAHRVRMFTLHLRPLPVRSTQEHREILTHLRNGDAEATRQAFHAHRSRAAKELLKILEQQKLS